MPIVDSLLDQDLYKLTMMQFVLHQFPGVNVKYKFKCRTELRKEQSLLRLSKRIVDEIKSLDDLRFNDGELEYLRSLSFFKDDFIDFLGMFRMNSKYVQVCNNSNELDITVKGPWLYTILYEIFILKIVNELHFDDLYHDKMNETLKASEKELSGQLGCIQSRKDIHFADFGTRRAFSKRWHARVIDMLVGFPGFIGTSNVMLAKKFNIKPIGTMAHEVFQVCQALTRIADSQKFALQKWADEYRGSLGIALSDTLGIDYFLKDFDVYFAKLFDGLRHDSGSPEDWVDRIIEHYEHLGIDPKTKTAVFSDGLTFERIVRIQQHVEDRIKTSYGIGTRLTNGFANPIQIVMKVVEANGCPVAKISDSPGKEMCEDHDYVEYVKKVIGKC